MKPILITAQILVSVILIGLILLQAKGTGLESGALFGGGEFYASKRGIEKTVFIGTIVLIVIFGILSVTLLVI